MKAIMIMYDSLNRHFLENFGCDWTITPNFKRLAEKTVTFDNSYIGSFPCMPARRELHTGRYNFLHRSWGPIEPYDDSMPDILDYHGIYSHLISDHQHYWEDGGATYHTRYSSWEIVRGQEGDRWKAEVGAKGQSFGLKTQDAINRSYINSDEKMPQSQTFAAGLEFLEKNHQQDNWFLQIETFDPHEPFFSQEEYKKLYPHEYAGEAFDWPPYGPVTEPRNVVEHCRYEYAALLTMCDTKLGMVLDFMDQHDMWKDTMLIVNTDHGFLLGEHNMWAKGSFPFYNEVAHTPLFVWDPRTGICGEHRDQLVQTIDLAPTVLEFFGIEIPKDMQGKPLSKVIGQQEVIHEGVLFGSHGGYVHVTDGRYVYMGDHVEGNHNQPCYEYTLMPTHMRCLFGLDELQTAKLSEPLSFTKDTPVLQIKKMNGNSFNPKMARPGAYLEMEKSGKSVNVNALMNRISPGGQDALYDLETDPEQMEPIEDEAVKERMLRLMVRLMKESDAPKEQYERLGLTEYLS